MNNAFQQSNTVTILHKTNNYTLSQKIAPQSITVLTFDNPNPNKLNFGWLGPISAIFPKFGQNGAKIGESRNTPNRMVLVQSGRHCS